jgi:ABC-type branched-subunit amino acid transport system substrate-binding protein
MVDVLQRLFNYTSVALAHSTDAYGAGGGSAFAEAADAAGLTVQMTERFPKDASDFSAKQRALQQSGARVVVLYCQASDGSTFLCTAFEVGLCGPGYLWFGGDTLADEGLWETDRMLASDEQLRERVAQGLVLHQT